MVPSSRCLRRLIPTGSLSPSSADEAHAGLRNASMARLLEIPAREFGPGREADLGEDAPDVAFHRPLGQHERTCDLAVGQRLRDQPGHLTLARSKRVIGARLACGV